MLTVSVRDFKEASKHHAEIINLRAQIDADMAELAGKKTEAVVLVTPS